MRGGDFLRQSPYVDILPAGIFETNCADPQAKAELSYKNLVTQKKNVGHLQ